MNIHFLVYCETLEFYWYECDNIPRKGEKIITAEGDFKVMEVCWKATSNYSRSIEITADPNYKDSTINIEGVTYPITRVGWKAYIWKPNSNASYTKCWGGDKYCCLLTEVDLRPDYVKEYYKSKGKEDKPFVWKDYYVENDYIVNPIRKNHGKVFDNGHIMWITKPVEPKVIHAPYIINEPTILI